MSLHKEIEFENDICAHLAAHGWLYAESDYAQYDRARALFPVDVIAWVQATQPKAWETLSKNHGAAAEAVLLDRIRKQLDDRGTLDVLRHGVVDRGPEQVCRVVGVVPRKVVDDDDDDIRGRRRGEGRPGTHRGQEHGGHECRQWRVGAHQRGASRK